MLPWQLLPALLFFASYFQRLKMVVSEQQPTRNGDVSDSRNIPRTTSVTTQLTTNDSSNTKRSQERSPLVGLSQHRMGCPSLNGFALQNWTVPEGRLTQGTSQITLGDNYLTRCMFRQRYLPRGKYCFAKVDTCPDDFKKGDSFKIKSVANPESPYVIQYCCRDDGNEDVAINFPTWEGPFFLVPYQSKCQQISGYDVTKEYWQWWLKYSDISASHLEAKSSPDKTVINMRVCYYAIKNYWPTDDYSFFAPPEGCASDAFQLMKFNPVFEGLGESFWLDVENGSVEARIGKLKFCKRKHGFLVTSKRQGFPTGQYCVLGNNQGCPESLSMEKVTVLNQDDVLFVFVYCCMVNGNPSSTINLPSKDPFYLLPYNFTCPKVKGMIKMSQSIEFKRESDRLRVQAPSFLSVQLHIKTTRVRFGLCKYQPKTTQGESKHENDLGAFRAISVAYGALSLVIVIVVYCCRRFLRRKIRCPMRHKPIQEETQSGSRIQMTSSCRNSLEIGSLLKMVLDPESQMTIYSLLIHPSKIETMENVGKGAFGSVYRGRYRPDANPLHVRDVAIKTINEHCAYPEISAFMEEAIVMADFRHANVLTIIGVCVHPTTYIPTLVLPFMEHGDLQKYLRKFRYEDDLKDKVPEPFQLISFCLHIARGMTYLSDMKFVHRDLAARNCMLDGNMMVKVADFGLARDIYSNSYYRQDKTKLLPIKWMALESLQDRVFSIYTDVWSYGVTVWEIFTLGKVPYPELENIQVLPELEKGQRLPKPDTCPDAVYELLLDCWQENPKSRPTFSDICKVIEQSLDGMTDYLDLDFSKDSPKTVDLSAGVVCSPADLTEIDVKEIHPQTSYADYRETWFQAQAAT